MLKKCISNVNNYFVVRMFRNLLFCVFFILPPIGLASAKETPEAFFQQLVKLSNRFDPALLDMYEDKAMIMSYRRYPHGLVRSTKLSGQKWKKRMHKLLPLKKKHKDTFTYTEVKVQPQGKKYKIKAKRYSESKCYWDNGYFLVVEPNAQGRLKIVEQYSEAQPQSNCL